jgi:hypothetical protein
MKLRTGVAAALAAGAVALGMAAAAQPASAVGFFQMRNLSTNKCLQLNPADPSKGIQVVQRACVDIPAQKWATDVLSNGNTRFINQQSGACLEVGPGNFDGATVDTWDCVSISNVEWRADGNIPSPVATRVRSKVSGGNRCLEVAGGSTSDFATIQIRTCAGTTRWQSWIIN